jgi:peptidoglycan/xylan/chitin deacetylase (PgdA/CDA1 family)
MQSSLVSRVSYAAKWLISHALYYSGALGFWCSVRLRGRVVVLTYHRVLPPPAVARSWSHPGIIVTAETFDRHVRLLKAHFQVLSVAEFVAWLEGRASLDRPACLITFDDGWRDTCTEAWPVLEKRQAPAVVFMPVRFIGSNRMFWQEALSGQLFTAWTRARENSSERPAVSALLARHGLADLLSAEPERVRDAIVTQVNAIKRTTLEAPVQLLAELEALLGPPASEDVDGFMTWEDARRMAAGVVDFGGHGATHRILPTLPHDEAAREAGEAMRVLQQELGDAALSFSYPNGNWNEEVAAGVLGSGFRVAFSTEAGAVSPGDDRRGLRRMNIHEDVTRTAPMFLSRLAGLF